MHLLLSGTRVMLTVVVVVVKEVKTSSNKGSAASEAGRGEAAFEQICKRLGKQPPRLPLDFKLNTSVSAPK